MIPVNFYFLPLLSCFELRTITESEGEYEENKKKGGRERSRSVYDKVQKDDLIVLRYRKAI